MKATSTGRARDSRVKDQLGRPVYQLKYLSIRIRGGMQHSDPYGSNLWADNLGALLAPPAGNRAKLDVPVSAKTVQVKATTVKSA